MNAWHRAMIALLFAASSLVPSVVCADGFTIGEDPDFSYSVNAASPYLLKAGAASATGYITEVTVKSTGGFTGLVVWSGYIDGNSYIVRDTHYAGSVASGLQTVDCCLLVFEGDMLGIYFTAGNVVRANTGGGGFYWLTGSVAKPGDTLTLYQDVDDRRLAVGGIGNYIPCDSCCEDCEELGFIDPDDCPTCQQLDCCDGLIDPQECPACDSCCDECPECPAEPPTLMAVGVLPLLLESSEIRLTGRVVDDGGGPVSGQLRYRYADGEWNVGSWVADLNVTDEWHVDVTAPEAGTLGEYQVRLTDGTSTTLWSDSWYFEGAGTVVLMSDSWLTLLVAYGLILALVALTIFRKSILIYFAGFAVSIGAVFILPEDFAPLWWTLPILMAGYFLISIIQGVRQ